MKAEGGQTQSDRVLHPADALRALIRLPGIVFVCDDKQRPMIAQSVVRHIALQALTRATCAEPDCRGYASDSVHGPVEDTCGNPRLHHEFRESHGPSEP
jgi:hypothetical protein